MFDCVKAKKPRCSPWVKPHLARACSAGSGSDCLAKSLAPPALQAGGAAAAVPLAIMGVIIAAIALLRETAAAIRAAARRQLQASINLALGSAMASIELSLPVVALASLEHERVRRKARPRAQQPLQLPARVKLLEPS